MTDPSKIFDGLLVLHYRSGNKSALNVLVKKYHKKLCKHSYWYTHDLNASRDIVQDCWSKIIFKLDSLKEPNFFGSWAFRIVTRKSLDYVRKRKSELDKFTQHSQSVVNLNEVEKEEEDVGKLRKAIKRLSNEQTGCATTFYTENYSLTKIRETL